MIKKAKSLSTGEFKSKIDNHEDFILVDVLDSHDYRKIHIKGAMNIPLKELDTKAEQWLNRHLDIIVYSQGPNCKGAEFAQEILTPKGFKVWTLQGGLEAWIQNQYPVEGDLNHKPHPIMAKPATEAKPKPVTPQTTNQPITPQAQSKKKAA